MDRWLRVIASQSQACEILMSIADIGVQKAPQAIPDLSHSQSGIWKFLNSDNSLQFYA